MGVGRQRERSGRRSPRRLLGHLLETRHGAAEGVLGAVALVLIIWLLWPEAGTPQLDHRAAWQESVNEAKLQRAQLETEQATDQASKELATESKTPSEAESRIAAVESSNEPKRRRIAMPSELADRLDSFGRRPGALATRQIFDPAPPRPSDRAELAIEDQPLATAEAQLSDGPIEPLTETTQPGSDGIVASPEVNDITIGIPIETGSGLDENSEPLLDVAVLSSEALDAEPLPEVDLSDLDSLVPLDNASSAKVEPNAPVLPVEPEQPLASAKPTEPVAPTESQATAEPFVVEGNPKADVKRRPRDNAPTWLKNAVAAGVANERPVIAVVIDDLGLNRPNTAALNDLPSPLTLAFLPYAGRIEAQTEAAYAAGHELMLHLPMEPVGADWPGPDALTTRLDQEEFTARLKKNLSRFKMFVGVNNHMGSRLTADRSRMDIVMRELRERDVLFLDSKTSARSVASEVAGKNGVPNTTRDIFLDHVIDLGAIKRQLVQVERVARQTGSAVAIGHPHGATIEALRDWLPELEARGFTLAPISAVVARRACNSGILIAAETCGRYLQARSPSAPALVAKGG